MKGKSGETEGDRHVKTQGEAQATASMAAELERLRAENARLNAFFGNASDAFIVLDERRKILQMNEAATQLTGFQFGEGLHCGDVFMCRDEEGTALRDELCFGRCSFENKKSHPYVEMLLTHRDGTAFPVSVSYSYIPLPDGRENLLMVMRDLTIKKRLEQEQLAKNELEITLKERERLSRDLHDGLVQSLAFLGLKSKMAYSQLENGNGERALQSMEEIKSVIQESYSEIRQALYDLRTPITEDVVGYLMEYAQNFTLQTKIEATCVADENFPKFNNARTSIHVLKVVQEAMNNVRKHAQATAVAIHLHDRPAEVEIEIKDNGRGFDIQNPREDGVVHYGLTTMEERMHLIGGRVKVETEPGQGTRVSLFLRKDLLV